jgi:polysaccharide deacetylase family protein (PEP-CTERM system associated)
VDVEDWRDARLAGAAAADEPAPGLERPLALLLDLFAARAARATFFVLGRLARHHPELIRRLGRDHEVATHGQTHTDLRRLDPARLRVEIRDSRRRLEDVTGRPVGGYRAPNWSLGAALPWGAEVIAAEGLAYDSSLIPGRGLWFLPGARVPRAPHRLAGTAVWEFPPTVVDIGFASAPAAGGAFLRLLPAAAILAILDAARASGERPHLHVHPWEIGPATPVAGAAGRRQRLLRAGAGRVAAKLAAILGRYEATAIGDVCGRAAERAA